MAHPDLIDVFNDCVDRMQAGQSLEDCLQRYPQYAGVLRPMLETGQAVRGADPALSTAARARMRARVMGAAPFVTRRRSSRARFRGVTLLAAALVMVLCAGVLIAILNRDDDPGLQAVPGATRTATALPAMTHTPTPTPPIPATASPGFTASPVSTATRVTPAGAPSATHTLQACTIEVTPSSVNLRAGPGTGYGVVDYAFAGDVLPVVARHTNGLWYAIDAGPDSGTLWIAASVGDLRGACDALPESGEPYREGAAVDETPPGDSGDIPAVPGAGADGGAGDDDDSDDDDSDDDDGDDDDDNTDDDGEDDD